MLAGNHDHGLVAGWIDARLQTEPAGFLGLEQHFEAHGPLARALAEAARPARLQFAYPGIWLRDDVYAFHGHYADAHATVPTFERHPRRRDGQVDHHAAGRARDARRLRGRAVARCTPGCTRSRSARTTRSSSKGGGASSRSYRALTVERSPALARAQDRLPRRGADAQLRSASARCSRTCHRPRCGAATCSGISEVIRRLRPRRGARHLGPLAPLRPVADRRSSPSGR